MAGDRRIGIVGIMAGVMVLAGVTAVALVVFLPHRPKSGSSPELSVPIERANNVKCVVQMNKINTALQMYGAENGKYPGRLEDLTVLSSSDLICPVSSRPFLYDSVAGRASCPGHY
jgi:hypothetical protein